MATTPERFADMLRPFREMGFGDFLVVARPPVDELTMELFAKKVAPRLRD
jgi:alkanesulfonate monooxygenase SsuD/methylene tetrahydromethanopterin reductase-like flavin-dependent oxidoreductase (luciferase family)